ncbi:MAG: PDZ domain-containing protein [Tahibacter sp.]
MRDGDALRVGAVAPDSAAQLAGVKADQRISRIDDQPANARSLNDWRERLRSLPVGAEVGLSIVGADATKPLRLHLSDRIPEQANPSTSRAN